MKVYIFKNSYYIGDDAKVTANALSSEEVELTDGYEFKVKDGVLMQEPSAETLLSVDVATTEVEDVPTQAEVIAGYTQQVQSYLDTTAQTRGYDGILSLCTYATSSNATFAKEGQIGAIWRDAVWTKCYEILAEVQAGTREVPTDIISELPVIDWGE